MSDAIRKLIVAIFAQALDDALDNDMNREKIKAIEFLTAQTGTYAIWRRKYCDMVNLDDDFIVETCKKLIAGDLQLDYLRKRTVVKTKRVCLLRALNAID